MAEWTDVVGAVADVGTVSIAAVAATVAWHQVKEARRLRIEQASPYVVVDLQSNLTDSKFLDLVILNTGTTTARNIRFTFSPELRSTLYPHAAEPRQLFEYPVLKDGIPNLPPGGEFRFLFEFVVEHYRRRDEFPTKYDVIVDFDDSRDRPCTSLTYSLDLCLRWSLLRLGSDR
ncbi:hypothetical protein ACFWDZ_22940 [Micromonospora aurantiaca]|uniref:hypothetical protein n=1 Tax=Micromonospora aurantiaca (nom. illeg.) TaxID=47850 RepID=UPI0013C33F8F|nr:hypothetical protein [Micromonospora aurantiaca]